ncbi:sensor histidine kinase [Agathobacter rectalis]|nr:GHKL domain-containing protein [Agathobacter rectalis]
MRILFSLIYISIIALFVIIFLLFTPQVFVLGKLDKISYFIISTICVILEEIVLIILLKQPIYAENFFHLLLFIFGLTLFLFVYISIYIYRLGKEKEKNDRLIQSITINQMEARQNEEIINSTHSLRVFKHDIMNHMSILYKLVENGKNSDALKYIYQINNSIERTSYTISTGIIPIDCIMTAKLSKALDNNISIKHQIHFPANYNISDMDLCSLISNLLDNAIEANCKLDITKRRLQIEIKPYNNMLLLFISNSSNGIYLYGGNGNLLTTKTSNKNEHGIGIKRINEIVKKYNGIIEFDPGTEIFSVSILFPLDN